MDADSLFKEITKALYCTGEVAEALKDCGVLLARQMPVELTGLQVWEPDRCAIREVARAGAGKSWAFPEDTGEHVHPLPPPAAAFFKNQVKRQIYGFGHVIMNSSADRDPMSQAMGRALDAGDCWSALTMVLGVQEEFIGMLVLGSRAGTFTREQADLLATLHEPFALALLNVMRYRQLVTLREQMAEQEQREPPTPPDEGQVVGARSGLREVMELADQVAPLDSPVLLLGETGVGKEVVARAIHSRSGRRDGPMVCVNCGAIPEGLMDSELFGHERGAFTGAVARHKGVFEQAHGGTLFLDEVGELPPQVQVRLLRVLQTKELTRVGGTHPVAVDARIVTATHRDIPALIAAGRFREDLWFRLNVFPVSIPPLRQRPQDIPALVEHFVTQKARQMNHVRAPALKPEDLDRLKAHPWPGNVRELENVIERSLILSRGPELAIPDLQGDSFKPVSVRVEPIEVQTMDEIIAAHIQRALNATEGRIEGESGAAERLGVHPSTLRSRMKKLGLWPTRLDS